MNIRLLSDIHLEFGSIEIPVIPEEYNTILILAGDIGVADEFDRYASFIHDLCRRHRKVIYVPGNHEHYNGSLQRSTDKIRVAIANAGLKLVSGDSIPERYPSNLHLANEEVVIVDDIAFICATMWTDYNRFNPIAMWDAQQGISDFKKIRHGTVQAPYKFKLTAHHIYNLHCIQREFVFDEIAKAQQNGLKTVVVTHHAMSYQSIADEYREGAHVKYNPCYASDYDNRIIDAHPLLMVHGHTHTSFDYMIEGTRVVCNPRGYVGEENNQFDPRLVIEI